MIIGYEQLADIRERHRDESIVYGSGCFDILHPGHLRQLEYVKSLGDVAVIGVTPDVRIKQRKGPSRPINPQDVRVAMVDALKPVDYCFISPETMPGFRIVGHGLLRLLRPDMYVTHDPAWLVDEAMLAEQGTILLPGPELVEGVSTTAIIDRIVGGLQRD